MSTNPYANPDYGNDKDKKEGGKAAANPYKDEKYGEARGFTGQAKDIGVSLLEGAVSVPEAAVICWRSLAPMSMTTTAGLTSAISAGSSLCQLK